MSPAMTDSTESGNASVVPVARTASSSSKRNKRVPGGAPRDLFDVVG